MLKDLLDVLLPKRCLGCGREGKYICDNCEIFLSEIPNLVESQSQTISVWEYEGIIKKAILKIKHDGCYDIINELVDKAFEKIDLDLPADTYITYVPIYKRKEKQKGFNETELIAKKIGEKTGKPVAGFLKKIKDKPVQTISTVQEKIESVKGLFSASLSIGTIPQTVVLVDDVYITGATTQAGTKALKEAGVKNILIFTLARKLTL